MKLPGGERAVVEPAKVRDYLLSPEHPVGRGKARFFAALGFRRDRSHELRDALLALARSGEASLGAANAFGQKYLVPGSIQGPAGRAAAVLTVWIVLRGEDFPRFVTAHPGDAG